MRNVDAMYQRAFDEAERKRAMLNPEWGREEADAMTAQFEAIGRRQSALRKRGICTPQECSNRGRSKYPMHLGRVRRSARVRR